MPTLRAPALARALFAHAESGRDIPAALYIAVAEVLAWVYQVRRAQARGEQAPPPPVDVPVHRVRRLESVLPSWRRLGVRSTV